MTDATQSSFLVKRNAALQALRSLHIPFRGPFVTPGGSRIFLVGFAHSILTEPEIVAFHEDGRLTPENAFVLLDHLQRTQWTRSPEADRGTPPGAPHRRSQRLMLQLAVMLKAEIDGTTMRTDAFTVVVNAHGGRLECSFRMPVGREVTLINPHSRKEVACTVVGVQRLSDGCFTTAFEFAERNPNFWPVLFPPLDWAVGEQPASTGIL